MRKRYALGRYTAGATAARTGDEMAGPALLLAGLAITGSAGSASALLAGATIAAAVGGPLLGVLLDRSARPGRLLAAALAGYALALLATVLTLGRTPLGWTVLIAVCAGLLGPALAGGWTAQLPRVVAPAGLPRANAVDAMTFNAAGLAGPALAGVAAELAGAGAGVVIAAVLICLALPAALGLPMATAVPGPPRTPPPAARPASATTASGTSATSATVPGGPALERPGGVTDPEPARGSGLPGAPAGDMGAAFAPEPPAAPAGNPGSAPDREASQAPEPAPVPEPPAAPVRDPESAPEAAAPATPSTVRDDLLAGFRAIARIRPLARATAVTTISCAGEGMLVACVPLLGERTLGGTGQGAALLSAIAVTALAANALLARRPRLLRPETVLAVSPVLLAAALALAALGGPLPLAAAVVLAGIGEGPQLTAVFAIRHRESPAPLRGQIFTTGASLKLTGFAVGAGVAGLLLDWSLPGALLAAAGVQLLAALVCVAWPRRPDAP
ncbi:MFS transporter [Streptomyces jumonjinensis]|uniref:MFS transporter n=1 Tax=Streptomyces jumonjinensis TaxID=1945 RepID=UPI0037A76828